MAGCGCGGRGGGGGAIPNDSHSRPRGMLSVVEAGAATGRDALGDLRPVNHSTMQAAGAQGADIAYSYIMYPQEWGGCSPPAEWGPNVLSYSDLVNNRLKWKSARDGSGEKFVPIWGPYSLALPGVVTPPGATFSGPGTTQKRMKVCTANQTMKGCGLRSCIAAAFKFASWQKQPSTASAWRRIEIGDENLSSFAEAQAAAATESMRLSKDCVVKKKCPGICSAFSENGHIWLKSFGTFTGETATHYKVIIYAISQFIGSCDPIRIVDDPMPPEGPDKPPGGTTTGGDGREDGGRRPGTVTPPGGQPPPQEMVPVHD
jgi:hypothetical protein